MKYRGCYRKSCRGQIQFRVFLVGLVLILGAVTFGSQSHTIHIENTAKHLAGGAALIKTAAELALAPPAESVLKASEMNVLVLGRTGPGHIAPNLTDTILVVSYNKSSRKTLILSIPRDLLVKIPDGSSYTKINALYAMGEQESSDAGAELITSKLSQITGLAFNYYVLIDVAALEQIIDSLDGVNVYVLEDIEDMRFPTPEGGYEIFSLEEGWRYLDGKTTTKYVRTRHTPRGDFDRVKRQQQVIEAVRKKVRGLNPLIDFPKYIAIYETLQEHLVTNISIPEAKALWYLAEKLPEETLVFRSLEGGGSENLLISKQSVLGGEVAYVLTPRKGLEDYSEIQQAIRAWLNE